VIIFNSYSQEEVEVKELVSSDEDDSQEEIDPMEIGTVTIVEEDGTTSVVYLIDDLKWHIKYYIIIIMKLLIIGRRRGQFCC
jgi:hypothetical protein